MNWDKYRYAFGAGPGWPAIRREVICLAIGLSARRLAGVVGAREKSGPAIKTPIDTSHDTRTLRLRAYVWPDQFERLERLQAAIKLARRSDLQIDKADAAEWVAALAAPRAGTATVLYHSVVWSYLPGATA